MSTFYLPTLKSDLEDISYRDICDLASSGTCSGAQQWLDGVLLHSGDRIVSHLGAPTFWGLQAAKDAITTLYHLSDDRIVFPTAGASGGIDLLATWIAKRARQGGHVLMPQPNYEPWSSTLLELGVDVRHFHYDKSCELSRDISARANRETLGLIFVNPNNPDSHYVPHDEMSAVMSELSQRAPEAFCIVDEVYGEVGPAPFGTAANVSPRIITISSLSKSFGLHDVRFGWVTCDGSVAPDMANHWATFHNIGCKLSEAVAALAFERAADFAADARRHLENNREILAAWICRASDEGLIDPISLPQGSVCFLKVHARCLAGEFCKTLREQHGVLVVSGEFFGGNKYGSHIRLSYGGDTLKLALGLSRLLIGLRAMAT